MKQQFDTIIIKSIFMLFKKIFILILGFNIFRKQIQAFSFAGRILKKVIENMVQKANGSLVPQQRKIFLFSGHENNVINILATLNLFRPHVPKYSAAVVIELHYLQDIQDHIVKVPNLKRRNTYLLIIIINVNCKNGDHSADA